MIPNVITVDPGVGGALAFTDKKGIAVTIPMPEQKKRKTKTGKIKPIPTKDKTGFQVLAILLIVEEVLERVDIKKCRVHIEHVHAKSSDTPKTAAALVGNYYAWLVAFASRIPPRFIKQVMPTAWQNQLGIALPSGTHNYERRKKFLKDFATEKFPMI